ncbi:hypothetical protein BKA56DRAFT_597818 [Ilyonectria sp. MPI-CAGE-AT-0026]|nr:hypothetical protein BKA56DRAFT_597818 [Ilyonectria sp. MPI-CAGE-AT-0026]
MSTPPAAEEDDVVYSESQASCHACRQRKQKCSREKPSCSNCKRLGISCIYDARKRKPGLKPGAVKGLTRRVEALETALHTAQGSSSAAPISNETGSAPELTTYLANSLTTLATTLERLTSKIDSLDQPVSRDRDHPTPSITNPAQAHALSSADDGVSSLRLRRTRTDPHHDQTALTPFSFTNPSAPISRCAYTQLPAELLDDVVQLYFMRIHNWIPILHWTRFKQKYRHGVLGDKMGVILNALIVGTLKYVDRERHQLSDSDVLRMSSECRDRVLLKAMDTLCVENLQALIILAFLDIGDGRASRAWSIIGSLSRTVEYLQLSVEIEDDRIPSSLPPLSVLSASQDWIEKEERRRVFWVIFNMDRFCSITTGWNTSLTADDVCRRLPADGTHWYLERPVNTPYFGIWDTSVVGIDKSLAFMPAIASGAATRTNDIRTRVGHNGDGTGSPTSTDLRSIGGLAYLVEATESMSRIVTYFLRQNINFCDERQVTSWLTRFKELDLRLVHWKLFLPKRWKDPNHVPDTSTGPKYHDHGMTLAHVMHNTSIVILHSRIAYSIPQWYNIVQLPSSSSAETCRLAAMKTASITSKYLDFCPEGSIVAPQFAFCIFINAKVLLIHRRHYNLPIQSEFWTMVDLLQQMATRWAGLVQYDPRFCDNVAGKYAERLCLLHEKCQNGMDFGIDVLDYVNDSLLATEMPRFEGEGDPAQNPAESFSNTPGGQTVGSIPRESHTPERQTTDWGEKPFFMDSPPQEPQAETEMGSSSFPVRTPDENSQMELSMSYASNVEATREANSDLVALSQVFMEPDFAGMDRIIGLNDDFLGDLVQSGEQSYMQS